jgi:hypothetical protein
LEVEDDEEEEAKTIEEVDNDGMRRAGFRISLSFSPHDKKGNA